MPRPITNTRRRPKRSASEPAVSSTEASVNAYALMTHWMSEKLALSSEAIFGSATFTIVMSSRSMNVAMQTTIRVHHLRSISHGIVDDLADRPVNVANDPFGPPELVYDRAQSLCVAIHTGRMRRFER